MSWSNRLILASTARWSVAIGSALVEFHPALERWLHADWSVDALQVGILDVLLNLCAEVDERLLLDGAPARGVGLGADAADDLRRLLENRVAVEVVEVPAGRAGLLGELARLLVEG